MTVLSWICTRCGNVATLDITAEQSVGVAVFCECIGHHNIAADTLELLAPMEPSTAAEVSS